MIVLVDGVDRFVLDVGPRVDTAPDEGDASSAAVPADRAMSIVRRFGPGEQAEMRWLLHARFGLSAGLRDRDVCSSVAELIQAERLYLCHTYVTERTQLDRGGSESSPMLQDYVPLEATENEEVAAASDIEDPPLFEASQELGEPDLFEADDDVEQPLVFEAEAEIIAA